MKKILIELENIENHLFDFVRNMNNLFCEPDFEKYAINSYLGSPSLKLIEKEIGLEGGGKEINDIFKNEGIEKKDGEQPGKINPYLFLYQARKPEYFGWIIRRASRLELGYGVLGRAFPYRGLIEVASDLYGNDFEEVKMHEILHMQHPEKSEMEIRMMTRMALPFTPHWH